MAAWRRVDGFYGAVTILLRVVLMFLVCVQVSAPGRVVGALFSWQLALCASRVSAR